MLLHKLILPPFCCLCCVIFGKPKSQFCVCPRHHHPQIPTDSFAVIVVVVVLNTFFALHCGKDFEFNLSNCLSVCTLCPSSPHYYCCFVGVALLFVIIIVCSAYWSPERPSSPLLLHKQQTQNTRKASGRSRLSSASDPSRLLFGLPEAYEEDAFVCNG